MVWLTRWDGAMADVAFNARLDGATQFMNRCYAPKMCKWRSSRRQGGFTHDLAETRLSAARQIALFWSL
jgi:hypothetical protein